ncbi:hypothetical protein CLAFUW4_08725 [Fulvia fulva]|uniref:uncharacterized protein n=1 Tax=Passalora fulva TaxID=5499 RepID=UPI0028529C4A|nr:uncharacterized protein CLAFUR5_20269 [Fulvia fulva]KAK4614145.1 hypothetical protein CLAFUR4_08730 [Fulvia fulva]KAK4614321.1 hypothetical protein CLAFUR0_08726 [Fulvia fulva]WMI38994.1 hypothetical protein CLAFUR5_20269 [Fulvia fulva]WPV20509.1 hypothetical protein CLAFUW4_08725 [Fulvia fulva]WPV35059.1 hypothetical protein CLAFUW7_08725 [Fulvia fulva]
MSSIDRSLHRHKFPRFQWNFTSYSTPAHGPDAAVSGAAWEALRVDYEGVIVPDRYAADFDIVPGFHLRVTPDGTVDGPPLSGYPSMPLALHHLHCLNLLRQGLSFNVDYYRQTKHPSWTEDQTDEHIEIHVAHCLDFPRELYMCHADS